MIIRYPLALVRSWFSAAAPLEYDADTGEFSLPQAGLTQDGYLSGADFATLMGVASDYLDPDDIDPGHKHSKLWASGGSLEAVTVDAAGNVGFGISDPAYLGHFVGGADGVETIILGLRSNFGTTATATTLRFGNSGSDAAANGSAEICALRTASGGTFLIFRTAPGGTAYLMDRLLLDSASNVGINTAGFGTSAQAVLGLGSGAAPTSAPANMGQLWVEDINGAAGFAGLHKMTETTATKEIIPGVVIKGNTGRTANPYEGLVEINTFDNLVVIYADGAWRTLASGW